MSEHANVKKYLVVFGALLLLTAATVGVSLLHLGVIAAVLTALLVATTKGGLVAAYFMHLIGEHRWVYLVLAFTVFFFIFLLLIPVLIHISDYRI